MNTGHFRLSGRWIIGIPLLAMACTVLPAQKDTTQFFILTAASESGPPNSSPIISHQELSIGLGPIELPGYLKRREIVTRVSGDQLQLSQSKRWAESLDSNFQRVLSQDLGDQLGTQRILVFPWYGRPEIKYQVEVQVHRFDSDATNHSHLDASWIIKDGKTGRELTARESNISSPVTATDVAGSEALSSALNKLSESIAESVLGLAEGVGMVCTAECLGKSERTVALDPTRSCDSS
jgi:uncharacterized protein